MLFTFCKKSVYTELRNANTSRAHWLIGKSIAVNAANRGIGVILIYNNNPQKGEAVAAEINASGGNAVALHLDAAAIETFDRCTKQVALVLKENWGRDNFDFLVNNAGIAQRSLITDTREEIKTVSKGRVVYYN